MHTVLLLAPEELCITLRDALRNQYITLPCSDPAIAGNLLPEKPDALILSLLLPGTDGLAFLKENGPLLPPAIIVLTPLISNGILQELHRLGVSCVIRFPCKPSYLTRQLHSLLTKKDPSR